MRTSSWSADQLCKRGISVVTAHDLSLLGASDLVHFRRAAEMGAVICTHDADFLILAAQGHHHAGIAFGQQDQHTIGDWVSFLTLIHGVYSAEDMKDRIEFL